MFAHQPRCSSRCTQIQSSRYSHQALPSDRGSAEELVRSGTRNKVFPTVELDGDGTSPGDTDWEGSASKCGSRVSQRITF
jgi:hypothetical protein